LFRRLEIPLGLTTFAKNFQQTLAVRLLILIFSILLQASVVFFFEDLREFRCKGHEVLWLILQTAL
jgi:hypothetical protein